MTWVVEHVHWDGSVVARVPLSGSELRIGRALGNDLVLDDPHCAAFHAVLRINAQGQAELHDLGTLNGVRVGGGGWRPAQRHAIYPIKDDTKIQVGASSIRVRHMDWPLPAEKPLSSRRTWPAALLALLMVLAYATWEIWLRDVHTTSPTYLSDVTGLAAGLAVWSSLYALLGRLFGGPDRFFTHLFIVCCAYLAGTLLHHVLDLLAFSFYWLWPLRIATYCTIIVVALTIRAHMRIADPRHWPVLRWGIALGAALAIAVPLAQTWISSKRLTHIQVMNVMEHPRLRLSQAVPVPSFMEATTELKTRADAQRAVDTHGDPEEADED